MEREVGMHVQVVTYRVTGISEAEFIEANKEFAEMMAAVPGFLAKTS
jgi:antibiotic biosynthesis monooxygenase (ABM) superfamily enzyme